ncbi:MAG TPA: hypothetical protein VEA79_05260 [Phenylobacterium sp.]|nr:hypothetical protein [Phenylobacterium sp.]
MRKGAALFLAALIAAAPLTAAAQDQADCKFQDADADWATEAMQAWAIARDDLLKVPEAETPARLILYDAACTFTVDADPWRAAAHGGEIETPDGGKLPAKVASFAAAFGEGQPFLVMALPSIWEAQGVKSDLGLPTMLTGVFLHEMTHTRQMTGLYPRIGAFQKAYGGSDFDDDIVQTRFEANAAFKAGIDAERDLLYRAAAAATDAEARALARQAHARIAARRAKWFTGKDAMFAEAEDTFLTLEGSGQWVAYAWLTKHPLGAEIEPATALTAFRRGGRKWSQDEGLALFLVIDRLVPDWQARVFSDEPASALQLLAEATR